PHKKITVPEDALPNTEKYLESIKIFFDSWSFFLFTPKLLRYLPRMRTISQKLLDEKAWYYTNLLEIIKTRRTQIEQSEDHFLSPDILTRFLTINTEKDDTSGISDVHHREPMSDEAICGNIAEILGGGTVT
ncbi:4265_t:CDS:1, partial [Acaulospora colombiana]